MEQEFSPSQVLNVQPKPRVLVKVSYNERSKFGWVKNLPGTYRFISGFEEIDPAEWDAVITNSHLTVSLGSSSVTNDSLDFSSSAVPKNLMVFYIMPPVRLHDTLRLLNIGLKVSAADGKPSHLLMEWDVPGNQVRQVSNLPESIQDLVKSSILPKAGQRGTQFGFIRTNEQLGLEKTGIKILRPFLFGPRNYILAGSLQKMDGISIWVVPGDLDDIEPWFRLALADWHTLKPKEFPGVGVWQTSPSWFTAQEHAVEKLLNDATRTFEEAENQFRSDIARLGSNLTDATENANLGRKRLLWAQDIPLQEAVRDALRDLGFDVEDMDLIWEGREPREDFRVRDADDSDWLVIADATGVAGGAKGSKIGTVMGYVTKYVIDQQPKTQPGIWLLINQLVDRDPDIRGVLFRKDDLDLLESADGLAVETTALYAIVEACSGNQEKGRVARKWLRNSKGEITLAMARTWLKENDGIASTN